MPKHKRLLLSGIAAMLLANAMLALHAAWPRAISANVADGLMGLCYGVSFGLLIMSIRVKTRRSAC